MMIGVKADDYAARLRPWKSPSTEIGDSEKADSFYDLAVSDPADRS